MKVARAAVVEGKEATPPGPPWAGTPTCITAQPPAILHPRSPLCNASGYPAVKHSGGDCGATLVGGPRRRPLAILTTLPRDAPCPSTVLVATLAPHGTVWPASCSRCTVCRNGTARKPMDTGAEYQSSPGAATPRSKPATSPPAALALPDLDHRPRPALSGLPGASGRRARERGGAGAVRRLLRGTKRLAVAFRAQQ